MHVRVQERRAGEGRVAPPRISWLRPLLALGAEIRRGWRTLFSDGIPRRLPRLRPRAGLRSWEPAGLAEYRAAAVRGPSRKDARIRISRLFVFVTLMVCLMASI